MHVARALAVDFINRPPSRHREFPRDPYVSNYPAPLQLIEQPAEPIGIQKASRSNTTRRAVTTASFIGLIASFSMHLINLRMQNIELSSSFISASVALQALVICITAFAARTII